MTLDELIAQAQKLREIHGGQIQVGCWPYDGQLLRANYMEGIGLVEYIDQEIIVGGYPKYEEEKRTFLMLEGMPS